MGVLKCKTVENPWFGIPAGREIELNLIVGGTGATLGTGAMRNMDNFNDAVDEIMEDAMAFAMNTTNRLRLKTIFFPKSHSVRTYKPSNASAEPEQPVPTACKTDSEKMLAL